MPRVSKAATYPWGGWKGNSEMGVREAGPVIVGSSLQINKETVLQQGIHATVAVRQGMVSMSVVSNTPPATNMAK